jgi:MmyB-like transcription regulator ligand binding domain
MTETSPTSSVNSPRKARSFRGLWGAHNVRLHTKGVKRFNHPIVGELELSFNPARGRADPGLMIVAYTAEPGSRSAEAFALLASWAATEDTTNLARANATARQADHETR